MKTSPSIKDFAAWINLQPPGPSKLIVKGKVETNGGNLVPGLTRAEPQGINPHQLILVLSIDDTESGGTDDVAFRDVRYEEPASSGQYSSVALRWDVIFIRVLDVTEVH